MSLRTTARQKLQDCTLCGGRHYGPATATNCPRYRSGARATSGTAGQTGSGLGAKSVLSRTSTTSSATRSTIDSDDALRLSAAVDDSGVPLNLYHGSAVAFDDFDPEFTGSGNDAYGSGFYFTTSEDAAHGYGEHVKSVRLDIRNPIEIDGADANINDAVYFTAAQSAAILRRHPDIRVQPDQAEGEDGEERYNPLGDFIPEFWDKPRWTAAEFDAMIGKVAREHYDDAPWGYVETMFDRGQTAHFRRAVQEVTGNDGVVVNCTDGSRHWVAWFPEQIHQG